ncbi:MULTISPECIES: ATP-binding protein [Acidobacterium]|uniref:histidine kinase n=1 Tax=Acidobacterium capsulatum (strain ATCC 51196 / DSM 11244 / BCRC 80197 / JCM 7670 / NBRC 15755 / NCIMB 13165 / 161) TaxID=240015 RepID=C1F2Z0_ACIC5|nr:MULTISPECIES: ATP-binding protein [Acidobacterium]ACO32632.1 bacteriophytochrome histidine kinase [Acidobacterium capsulatum ATCC 51196]HCT60129.1 ATPase [Acidobacterium sp.]
MTSLDPISAVNLTNCDRELIHIPGSVQAHGFLLVFARSPEDRLIVVQASQNAAEWLGRSIHRILGGTCTELFDEQLSAELREEFHSRPDSRSSHYLRSIRLASGEEMELITHSVGDRLAVEFERVEERVSPERLNKTIVNVVAQLETIRDIGELARTITVEIRTLTGFDRVLLYSFDEEGHGTVIAEDNNGNLPSMLHLRFPATDIPKQARHLYLLNRIRIIPDVNYVPSPLLAVDSGDEPMDMTYCVLRSVSPVHREYMRNMGTAASMSFSVVVEGKLWGMISCHHATALSVPYVVRSGCDVLTRIVAAQISAYDRAADFAEAIRLKAVERDLLTYMTLEEKYVDGLTNHPDKVMALTRAAGAAFVLDEACLLMGETPNEAGVRTIADWLRNTGQPDLFATDHLSPHLAAAEGFLDTASGLLAISLSQVHRFQILWFRPEIIRTVHWAGEPLKTVSEVGGIVRIDPRHSFEGWSELVRQRSDAWSAVEIEAARDFRNAMLFIVLRRAEELADMAAELEFTNKELEAFSYSVSHDLRAPFRHISGFAELLLIDESDKLTEKGKRYIEKITQSAQFAGVLVDSLLNFSQIARTKLAMRAVAMEQLVSEVWEDVVSQELRGREVEFSCGHLPLVEGDVNLLRQVWRNLLSNAAKYTSKRALARIEVSAHRDHQQYIFSVRDNGVGFDNRYAHKLFGAFQRLHRIEEFEGTGIGLANVRRIVARHGGQTWAEGKLNVGAVFFFSLPIPESLQS